MSLQPCSAEMIGPMIIEERCACGAGLRLVVDQIDGRSLADHTKNDAAKREAWKQVDRWRKLHAACRQPTVRDKLDPPDPPPS